MNKKNIFSKIVAFLLPTVLCFTVPIFASSEAFASSVVPDNNFHPPTFTKATWPGRALLLPDGKYLLFFGVQTLTDQSTGALVRFLPDGTLDTSFSFSRDYKDVGAVAAGPGGKVYVSASRYVYGILEAEQILRLNVDGSIDSTFAPATVGSTDGFPEVQQIVVQTDGRVLVAGFFLTFAGNDARNGIVRLMTDGTVDPSFAPVTVSGSVYCTALQPDGKILIGGSFGAVNGVFEVGVARLKTDGSLDSSFQSTGFAQLGSRRVRSIVVQPDGLILISGNFRVGTSSSSPRMPVLRLTSTGSVDTTFNSTGLVGVINTGRDLVLQSDNKILAVINNSVYRLNLNGSKDASFRQPAFIDAAANPATPVTLQLYSDGRMLVGGFFTDVDPPAASNFAHFGVVRLNSDGNVNPSLVSSHRTANEIAPSRFVRLNDGSTLVTFSDNVDPAIPHNVGRLLDTGALDPNYALSSSDPNRFLANFSGRGIEPLPDGNLFVYGIDTNTLGPVYAKVQPNGAEDTSFATNHGLIFQKIIVAPDGKILAFAGTDPQITLYSLLGRLTAAGQVDTYSAPASIAAAQIVRDIASGQLISIYVGSQVVAVQPDGKALFQYFSQDQKFHLVRLNVDGSFDATFTETKCIPSDLREDFPVVFDPVKGNTLQPPEGVWSATAPAQAAYIQPDGHIILVGHFESFGSSTARDIVRIDSHGAVDPAFNPGSGAQWTTVSQTSQIFPSIENIEPTADGKFLITGNFEAYNGTAAPGIARLNADGSIDTSFVAPVHRDKRSLVASAFRSQPEGSFLLSGPYAVGNETATRSLIRLVNAKAGAVNISTRLGVGTDDNVLIEGFIVQGPPGSSKKIIVRAIGPSLSQFGITDALQNPTLEIHDVNNNTVATNNDWKITQLGGLITGDQFAEINASGVAPANELESAIVASLAPGTYTAVVRGAGNSAGTGVVDAFDLDPGSSARLANIATRGLVQPGDKLMIAGFIVQYGPVKVAVRAIGPSLIDFGVSNALPDTTLQLRDQQGALVMENDDWQKGDTAQELRDLQIQPSHNLEAAFVTTILPGQYTAQLRGKGDDSGIGVVQVYFLQ